MELTFLLKKVIGLLLMPMPFSLLLLAVASVFWWRQRKPMAIVIAGFAVVWVYALSLPIISSSLIKPLETQYPAFDESQAVDYVVVLGSGHRTSDEIPITSQLTRVALARFLEGVRIQQLNPESQLIFTGYAGFDENPHAVMQAKMAQALGYQPEKIILREQARDTREEALSLKELLKDKPFALVTSASHMPRSMYWFQQAGLTPIPAPTAHLGLYGNDLFSPTFVPKGAALHASERAIYEYVGLLWAYVKS